MIVDAMKKRVEIICLDLKNWKATAIKELHLHAIPAWKEWGHAWLLPDIFEEDHHSLVQEIEEKYAGLQKEVASQMEKGEMSMEEAVEESQ
jgi:hypothetical protein